MHDSITTPLRTYPGQILGFRVDGRPIRAIAGGAPDDDAGDGAAAGASSTDSGQNGQSGTGSSSDTQNAAQGDQKGDQKDSGQAPQKVEDLPDWAQKVIRDARKDAGDSRTAAKKAEQDLVQRLGKSLGLIKDDEPADPAKLTEALTTAQTAQRQAQVELAVYRVAGKHQGDPDALLDSRSFLTKVAALDPTADDFAAKVEAAVKATVNANPKLRAVTTTGASSVDHTGHQSGTSRTERPRTLAEATAAHYGT